MQLISLKPDQRNQRLTINDAIAVVEAELKDVFHSSSDAKVRVYPLKIAPNNVIGMVCCEFPDVSCQRLFTVTIATARHVVGTLEHNSERRRFEIFEIDEAQILSAGCLALRSGTKLRAVEVVPAKLSFDLTDLERRIIKFAVDKTREFDRCYSDPFVELRSEHAGLPELRVLDFSKIGETDGRPRLVIAPIKVLQLDFLKANPDVRSLSRQTISDALAKAGLHVPIRRPNLPTISE